MAQPLVLVITIAYVYLTFRWRQTRRPLASKEIPMASVTTKSRPLAQFCRCGQQVVTYVTSQGWKSAPYCSECAKHTTAR